MIKEDDENDAELLVNACLMVEEANEMSETNSNNFLQCELCHQIMQSPDLRSLHYVLNHGCSICSVCSQVSITMNSFKIHVRSNHSQFSCDLCESIFLTHGELLKHRNNFHELFKCPLCSFEFFCESNIDSHLFKFHRISVNNFLLSHNFVAEWSESNPAYLCNMCGVRKDKSDVFSHFLDHHQISLLPLAQKFMSQNLNIRVIGVDSEIEGQFSQNIAFCKGCSEHISDDVPLSAHKFICLGDVLCNICLKSYETQSIRDSHLTKEHCNYPCVLGCSNRIVFDVEDKLHEHCLTVHDVKPCFLCGSFIRCAEGLMKQHLQMCHLYYRSDEILSSDLIFNVHCGNMSVNLICNLCDFDALIQISSVVDLFKHLNYHSVSFKAAVHFLEKNSVNQNLYLRLKELRYLDTLKASIQNDGAEQVLDEPSHLLYSENMNDNSSEKSLQTYPDMSNDDDTIISVSKSSKLDDLDKSTETDICCSSNEKPAESNINDEPTSEQQSEVSLSHSESNKEDRNYEKCFIDQNVATNSSLDELKSNCVSNTDKPVENNESSGSSTPIDVNQEMNVPDAEMGAHLCHNSVESNLKDEPYSTNLEKDEPYSTNLEKGIEGLSSTSEIANLNSHGDDVEINNCVGDSADDCSNNRSEEVHDSNVQEENHPNNVDQDICFKKEMDDDSGDEDDEDDEDNDDEDVCSPTGCSDMQSDNEEDPDFVVHNSMRLKMFSIRAEIDPCEVECVVTDTSDIESDNELPVKEEPIYENDTPAESASSNLDEQLGILKTLPGLNRMEVDTKGFFCEVCCGKFEQHEGMRELIKHMKNLHGFSCNFNGLKLSATFKFNRMKGGSSINMQPGLVCPECLIGWKSKRLLRKHVSISHGIKLLDSEPAGPLSYQCRFCQLSFWRASECFTHEKENHTDQKTYECHVCTDVTLRKVLLNKHLKRAHPSEKLHSYISFKCKQCLKLYPSYGMLDRHVRLLHPSCVIFRCPHCHNTLKSKKTLAEHVRIQHSTNQEYECEHCGRTMYSKRALSIHTRLKHEKAIKYRFKCRLCDKILDSKEERETHYKEDHAEEDLFHCDECGKGFASKSGLYGHKQVHLMSIDAFKCDQCDKMFSRRDSYNEHLQIHAGPRHSCPYCNKEFVQRSNMIRHIRIHTGEKPYKCSFCDKMFSDKGACNAHIRVHTREEVTPCPYCGKMYSKKQKLKYHIRKHTGEGLVPCKVCGKSFTHNFQLKEHILTHQSQLSCEQCGKAFNSEKYLQRHVESSHSPTHVYSCQLCTKTFTKEARARKHLISHASYKTLLCPFCGKHYTTLNSLKKHLTSIHKLQKEHPDFKSALDKLTVDREILMKTQKEIDFNSAMVSVPIMQLKTINQNNNNKDEDYDKKFRKRVKKIKKSDKDVKNETVTSIGQRVLSNSRKSRPKCLVEFDVEELSSNDSCNQQQPSPSNSNEPNDDQIVGDVQEIIDSENNLNTDKPQNKRKSLKSSSSKSKKRAQ